MRPFFVYFVLLDFLFLLCFRFESSLVKIRWWFLCQFVKLNILQWYLSVSIWMWPTARNKNKIKIIGEDLILDRAVILLSFLLFSKHFFYNATTCDMHTGKWQAIIIKTCRRRILHIDLLWSKFLPRHFLDVWCAGICIFIRRAWITIIKFRDKKECNGNQIEMQKWLS